MPTADDTIGGGDFERALLADVAALEAREQQRWLELQATADRNLAQYQHANRAMHQALFGTPTNPPPAAPADGSLT